MATCRSPASSAGRGMSSDPDGDAGSCGDVAAPVDDAESEPGQSSAAPSPAAAPAAISADAAVRRLPEGAAALTP
jgi:hypothetical protein